MSTPMLEIRKLCKSFPVRNAFGRQIGAVAAVDEVSFAIEKGQVYGLAGESGSGKSTIARMIMGLERPDSGDILINGESLSKQSRGHRRHVQMVFQNPGSSLNPRRTVGQSVMVPLDAHDYAGNKRQLVSQLLEMVQLPADFADRYPHELSGGQKQRVAIARALAAKPDVLLLDEPFSAVDALTRMELQTLVLELCQRNRFTAILVTHDVEEAVFMADRVAVLTNRPTRVAEILPIDLERPRKQLGTREQPRFLELRHHLMTALLGDVAEAGR